MKTAREKFPKDCMVVMSARGMNQFHCDETVGMVVGFSYDPKCVRVIKEGEVNPCSYHMDFWDYAQPEDGGE